MVAWVTIYALTIKDSIDIMNNKFSNFILMIFAALLFSVTSNAQSLSELITSLDKTEGGNEKITLLKKIGVYYQNQKAFAKS